MTVFSRHQLPPAAYPRFHYFLKRLESIYPRFRKAVGKKIWRTTGDNVNKEDTRLLNGPLRKTGELHLSSLVNISYLAKIAAAADLLRGKQPQVWICGKSLDLKEIVQNTTFPKTEQYHKDEVDQTKVAFPRDKNESFRPLAIVFVIDISSQQNCQTTLSALEEFVQAIPDTANVIVCISPAASRIPEDMEAQIRLIVGRFGIDVHDWIVQISALNERLCEHFERKIVRALDLIFDYIGMFPCKRPTNFVEDLDTGKGAMMKTLIDRIEQMLSNRWYLLDVWLCDQHSESVSLELGNVCNHVKSAMSVRCTNVLHQSLHVGGMGGQIIYSVLQSVIDADKFMDVPLQEDFYMGKFRNILCQQLHLDHLHKTVNADGVANLIGVLKCFQEHAKTARLWRISRRSEGTKEPKIICGCFKYVHFREYRIFASTLLQSIGMDALVSKVRAALNVVDNAMFSLHQLQFEVHGVLRQTLERNTYPPLYTTGDPKEIAGRLKLIDGVAGCGLFFGILHVHLKQEIEEKQMESAKSKITQFLLKQRVGDFSIETIRNRSLIPFVKPIGFRPGSRIWPSTEEEEYGTLGGFVQGSNEKELFGLTCGHCVHEKNSVYIYLERMRKKVPIGSTECVVISEKEGIDIAAVRVDPPHLRCTCSRTFQMDSYPIERFGELFEGSLDDMEDVTVFKSGASTGITDGVIACKRYHNFKEDQRHIIFIGGDDFALPGDSGAVVFKEGKKGKVDLLSMVAQGNLELGPCGSESNPTLSQTSTQEEKLHDQQKINDERAYSSSQKDEMESPKTVPNKFNQNKNVTSTTRSEALNIKPSAPYLTVCKDKANTDYKSGTLSATEMETDTMSASHTASKRLKVDKMQTDDGNAMDQDIEEDQVATRQEEQAIYIGAEECGERPIEDLSQPEKETDAEMQYGTEILDPGNLPKCTLVLSFRLDEGIRRIKQKCGIPLTFSELA